MKCIIELEVYKKLFQKFEKLPMYQRLLPLVLVVLFILQSSRKLNAVLFNQSYCIQT